MAVVSLTSDFGLEDYHVGVIKGSILCKSPEVTLVDISHNIKTYDIVQAAYVIKNAYPSFPKESIHIISVNDYYGIDIEFVAIKVNDQYFIGPNNGVFSLVFDLETLEEVYVLDYNPADNFPLKTIYADAVEHILSDKAFNLIGKKAGALARRISLQAVFSESQIRGTIIYIDSYENVVININRSLFERVSEKRGFKLFYKRNDPICKLSQWYHDVPVGEILCRFNAAENLEIAINMGKAASLLSLKLDDSVQIDFEDLTS